MSIKLNSTPSLHLKTKEDLLNALANCPWEGNKDIKYLVRSDFIIEAMTEMAAKNSSPWDTLYNAEIQDYVAEKLGHPEWDEPSRANSKEADILATLVYNCQSWRQMDMLKSLGFVEGTEALLSHAFENKMVVENASGGLYHVREICGVLYAMVPKSRTKYMPVVGTPIRLLTQKQAKAVQAYKADQLKPNEKGLVIIKIGGGHPAPLEALGV